MLIRFLVKRVAILAAILALCAVFVDPHHLAIPIGLALGGILGVYRTRLNEKLLKIALSSPQKIAARSTLFSALSQVSVFIFLTVGIVADIRLFIGMSAGFLLVPAVICINGITEKLGLTHNQWGGCI